MNAATLALAVLELIKLHFLASWAFLALGEPFPYLGASIVFFVAFIVSGSIRRRGARVIVYALAEFVVFAISFMALWVSWTGRFAAILRPATLPPHGGAETAVFFTLMGTLAVYCLRAAWLETKSGPREFRVARFDEGIAIFLGGLAIAALIRVENPVPARLTVPFFIAGILALGLSSGDQAAKGRLAAPTRAPALVGAGAAFLLAAIGIAFLIPAMAEPARRAAVTMRDASGEALRLIAAFLTWFFQKRRSVPRFAEKSARDMIPSGTSPGDPEQKFSAVLMWIVLALVGIAVTILVIALLVYLFRILASRTKKPGEEMAARRRPHFPWALVAAWTWLLSRLKRGACGRQLRARMSPAAQAYHRLIKGARAVGLRRAPAETAREFARRLAAAYPKSAGQAPSLVRDLEAEVYGGRPVSARGKPASGFARLAQGTPAPGPSSLDHPYPRFSARGFLAERLARLARRS